MMTPEEKAAATKAHKILGAVPAGVLGTQEPIYQAFSILDDALAKEDGAVTGPPDDYTDQLKEAAADLFGVGGHQQSGDGAR